MTTIIPSRKLVASAFSKGSHSYDLQAKMQREILQQLAAKLPKKNIAGSWIDLGSGTGLLESMLVGGQKKVPLVALDIALEPLKILFCQKNPAHCSPALADIHNLPFKPKTFSLAIMSSVLQWLKDPQQSLSAISSALTPNGKLFFSAFCEGTFSELFTLRSERNLSIPIKLFNENLIRSMIENSNFKIIKLEMYHKEIYFRSAWDVLKNLSALGASATVGPRLLRKQLFELCDEYEARFQTLLGVPVSYSIALGIAQKGSSDES